METNVDIKQKDSVLGFNEKFAFFIANLGNVPIWVLISTYLLLYYTDVVGLDPVAIGTLFLVARVMNSISGPIMGYVIDHLPRLKMGRFRGYILIGLVPTAIAYILLWLGPNMATSGKLVIAYAGYLLIGWSFALMDIPLASMIPVMSDTDKDRTTLSIIKGVAGLLASIVIVIGGLPLINAFPTKQEGYYVLIITVILLVALTSVFGTLGIKERIFPTDKGGYKLKNIKEIFGSRPVLILALENYAWQSG
jgi:Na+/melibiose symporter-like transporter